MGPNPWPLKWKLKPLLEVPRHSDISVLFIAIASSPEEPTQLQNGENKGVIYRAPATAAPRRRKEILSNFLSDL